jgi:hypothetical protein
MRQCTILILILMHCDNHDNIFDQTWLPWHVAVLGDTAPLPLAVVHAPANVRCPTCTP